MSHWNDSVEGCHRWVNLERVEGIPVKYVNAAIPSIRTLVIQMFSIIGLTTKGNWIASTTWSGWLLLSKANTISDHVWQ